MDAHNHIRSVQEQVVATDSVINDNVRAQLMTGFATVLLLVGGLGGWAATSSLAGAVLAAGTVVVDSNVKKVQHPTGGVVGEIRVRDGDRVAAGDLVMRLDEVITRANLGIVASQLNEFAVRQARLKAERDGSTSVEIPRGLLIARRRPTSPNHRRRARPIREPPHCPGGAEGATPRTHHPASQKKLVVSRRSNARRPMNWS